MLDETTRATVFRFLQDAQGIESLDVLNTRFIEAVKALGFSGAVYIRLSADGRVLPPRPVFGDPPEGWVDHYFAHNYARFDTAIPLSFQSREPFTWSEAAARGMERGTQTLFGEAYEWWRSEVLICPVRGINGGLSIVDLTMDRGRRLRDEERSTAHALASLYAVAGEGFLERPEPAAELPKPLTWREAECVYWVCLGKSDDEIGRILSISKKTANHHVESAKTKLGVASRASLAWRAFALGLVQPPVF
ncbi:MAG: autoinducer binding domain-containing protein [Caulobacter sp.]|nr:autoinducer binding domain-containing protein [Caulobacter sp.]